MSLKPTIWEAEVSPEFVDETIKYLEDEASLGDIDMPSMIIQQIELKNLSVMWNREKEIESVV